MKMDEYLGRDVTDFLNTAPFKDWPVEKSVENELGERIVHYIFDGNGLELRCDGRENISTIFLYFSEYGGFDESLAGIPFNLRRNQVLDRFGPAQKSGEKFSDPILGDCGAWDRFSLSNCVIHFEYKTDADAISKITFIRRDTVPS